MKKQYCAIIGDIRDSRQMPQRFKVQNKFLHAMFMINKEFSSDITSRFLITLGDEFQGLLDNASKSYQIIQRIQNIMDDTTFAFGIGIGTLATKVRKESALGMDGECFYRARAALSHAKSIQRQVVYNFNDSAEPLINAIIGIFERQWSALDKRQKQIYNLRKQNLLQAEISKKLGITQQAISKAIASKSLDEMNNIEFVINEYLKRFINK
jgi:hypothetical protein